MQSLCVTLQSHLLTLAGAGHETGSASAGPPFLARGRVRQTEPAEYENVRKSALSANTGWGLFFLEMRKR
jgi:hypothetical protein